MSFEFTQENKDLAADIIKKYPPTNRLSAVMPVLTLAQKQNQGYLTAEVMSYVAQYLTITEIAVYTVASFYSMYKLSPVGKYNVQVCNSVVCSIKGSDDLYRYCKHITNTTSQDISDDGLFSVQKVECLGACVNAIAVKINDIFYEDVTKEDIRKILEELKKGEPLEGTNNIKQSAMQNISSPSMEKSGGNIE